MTKGLSHGQRLLRKRNTKNVEASCNRQPNTTVAAAAADISDSEIGPQTARPFAPLSFSQRAGINTRDPFAPPAHDHDKPSTDTKFWLFLTPFLSISLTGWFYVLWWLTKQAPELLPRFVKLLSSLA
jgi:hypothetical protein